MTTNINSFSRLSDSIFAFASHQYPFFAFELFTSENYKRIRENVLYSNVINVNNIYHFTGDQKNRHILISKNCSYTVATSH